MQQNMPNSNDGENNVTGNIIDFNQKSDSI